MFTNMLLLKDNSIKATQPNNYNNLSKLVLFAVQ